MTSILQKYQTVLRQIMKWVNTSNQVSFVEVKELFDNAYAVADNLTQHNVLIRKANRLQERYLGQLAANQPRLVGAA